MKDEKAGDPPLDKYLSELEKLTLVLESVGAAPSGDADSQLAMTQHAIEALLTSFVEPTRSKLASLLMAPVQMTKVPVSVLTTNNWQAVYEFWHRQLSVHRPFDQSARSVANFEDFKKFAQPTTGLLWEFVGKFKGVELSGDHYVARPNGEALVHDDFVKCLNDAKEISDAFLGPGGGLKVGVWVGWSGSDVTEARMLLDKKPTPLSREQWTPVTWAGESEVTLEWIQGGLPQDIRGHDSFALHDLFRILGGLRPAGAGVYVSQAPPLTVKIRSLGETDSLRPDFLSRLQCPSETSSVQP
ncbi:MAG: hypothetical protein M3O36_15960 [Myxococcota bacterium]|nr:hypothetical protein [Myxococcota bacterium]